MFDHLDNQYNAGPTLWSEWSACSTSCGTTGTRTRIRFCYNPLAEHGGDDCPATMPMHEEGTVAHREELIQCIAHVVVSASQ
jgi:hypothetical protein